MGDDGTVLANAVESVALLPGPTGGSCTLVGGAGVVVLQDEVSVACLGFRTAYPPLVYEFALSDGTSELPVRTTTNNVVTVVPPIPGRMTGTVRVTDRRGGTTVAYTEAFDVLSNPSLSTESLGVTVASAVAEFSANQQASLVSLLGAAEQLPAGEPAAVPVRQAIADGLLALVGAPYFTPTSSEVVQVLQVVASVARVPEEVSCDTAASNLDVFEALGLLLAGEQGPVVAPYRGIENPAVVGAALETAGGLGATGSALWYRQDDEAVNADCLARIGASPGPPVSRELAAEAAAAAFATRLVDSLLMVGEGYAERAPLGGVHSFQGTQVALATGKGRAADMVDEFGTVWAAASLSPALLSVASGGGLAFARVVVWDGNPWDALQGAGEPRPAAQVLTIDAGAATLPRFVGVTSTVTVAESPSVGASEEGVRYRVSNLTSPTGDTVAECRYFDVPASRWLGNGCTAVEFSDGSVTCRCSHLTSFSVLLGTVEEEFPSVIQLIALCFLAVSVSLVAVIMVLITVSPRAAVFLNAETSVAKENRILGEEPMEGELGAL